MQMLARVSGAAIVGLLLINLSLGIIGGILPHRERQAEALGVVFHRASGLALPGTALDIGRALTAEVNFFGNRVLIDVEGKRLTRSRNGVHLALVVTPRQVEGYPLLLVDRLAVDVNKTAIVTADGVWFHVQTVRGLGLLFASEVRRSSPIYVIGVPRQAELVFSVPSSSGSDVALLVQWAPGRSATYAAGWRVDRTVEMNLPLAE